MPTFKAPVYSKTTHPTTGATEACYTFSIFFEKEEAGLTFITETKNTLSLSTLQQCVLDNLTWWNNFIDHFLKATTIFFSKPYSVEQINKIAKHSWTGKEIAMFPANVTVYPSLIQITGGQFVIHWEYHMEPMIIRIPVLEESESNTKYDKNLPVSNEERIERGLEELNMDQLPMEKDSTEETLEVENPIKFYDKQRVKEARLKAKLAMYKADRQMTRYYEKYGVNDVTDSETEWDTSDEEGEEEEEEVQL